MMLKQNMHELSLSEGVLALIEDAARRENFSRVAAVWLEVGRLSCIERDAMTFCFDAVARGSVAEGARLEFVDTPGSGWCMACARTVPIETQHDACPECGSYQVRVTGGTGMRVKELEVAT